MKVIRPLHFNYFAPLTSQVEELDPNVAVEAANQITTTIFPPAATPRSSGARESAKTRSPRSRSRVTFAATLVSASHAAARTRGASKSDLHYSSEDIAQFK